MFTFGRNRCSQSPEYAVNGNLSATASNGGATALSTSANALAVSPANKSLTASATASSTTAASADTNEQIATLLEIVESALARVNVLEEQLAQSESTQLTERTASTSINASKVTVTALETAGIESSQAAELVSLNEQMELDALALRDTATREGWLISDRYRHASVRLQTTDNPLRLSLGDEDYAKYLQSTEQPSRVVIETVLSNSAAFQAGLQAGDEIQDYAGAQIFTMDELQMGSTSGQSNQLVEVIVLRSGEAFQLFMERGPLGIRAIHTLADSESVDVASSLL